MCSGVYGLGFVSWRGGAGVESALPSPLGSTFASISAGLGFSRILIALPSSYVFFCTCLDQARPRFGLGLARGFLRFLRLSFAWRQPSLEPAEASCYLLRWSLGWRPSSLEPRGPGGCKVWVWLEASSALDASNS